MGAALAEPEEMHLPNLTSFPDRGGMGWKLETTPTSYPSKRMYVPGFTEPQ